MQDKSIVYTEIDMGDFGKSILSSDLKPADGSAINLQRSVKNLIEAIKCENAESNNHNEAVKKSVKD